MGPRTLKERFGDRISNVCDRLLYLFTGNLFKPHLDKNAERDTSPVAE